MALKHAERSSLHRNESVARGGGGRSAQVRWTQRLNDEFSRMDDGVA